MALGAALLIILSSFFWVPPLRHLWLSPLRYFANGVINSPNYEQILSVRPSKASAVTPAMLTRASNNYSRRLRALEINHDISEQPPNRLVVRMTLPPTISIEDLARPHLITRRLTLNVVHEENDKIVAGGDPVPDGFELLTIASTNRLVVSKKPLLEDAIEYANATANTGGSGSLFAVDVQLTEEATRDLNDAVTKTGKLRLAFVLDGKVIIAPTFREVLNKGSARITGLSSARDASDLAIMLRSGGVPWPLFLESSHFLNGDSSNSSELLSTLEKLRQAAGQNDAPKTRANPPPEGGNPNGADTHGLTGSQ
jgi:preprotein translocase subunit SecD